MAFFRKLSGGNKSSKETDSSIEVNADDSESYTPSSTLKGGLMMFAGSGLGKKVWKAYVVELVDKELLIYVKNKAKPKETIKLHAAILKSGDGLCGEPHTIALAGVKKEGPLYLKCNGESEKARWMAALTKVCANTEWSTSSMTSGFLDPVMVADKDVNIIDVNDAFLALFGYSRAQVIGKSVEMLMPEKMRPPHKGYVERFHRTKEKRLIGQKRALTAVDSQGKPLPIVISLGVEGDGDATTFLAVFRLDEDKKLNEASKGELAAMLDAAIDDTMDEAKTKLHVAMEEHLSGLLTRLNDARSAKKLVAMQGLSTEKRDFLVELDESDLGTDASEKEEETLTIDTTEVVMGRKLGGGGSGAAVYACKVDGWECAVKELPLAGVKQSTLDNCLAELVLLESLPKHKNLVKFLFHQRQPERIRIFMSRYEETLDMVLKKRREQDDFFTQTAIIKMVFDVVRALEILHDFHVIHRDVKSANLFVNYDQMGNISHLTLSDFDSAKVVTSGADQARTIIGTVGWMPPEIYNSSGKGYTFSADIWSLGACWFEMMDLSMPYETIDEFDRPGVINSGKLPTFRNEGKIKTLFGGILFSWEKLMALNPADRPSLKDVRVMLSEHL